MALAGKCLAELRLPMYRLTDEKRAELKATLTELNLIG